MFPEQVQKKRNNMLLPIALVLACATALLVPTLASPSSYTAPGHKIWAGISDTGRLKDFQRYGQKTGKHPAVLETFHGWGMNAAGHAAERWNAARVRPMLHISTTDSYGGHEKISPRSIARGKGDDYLLLLNHYFGGQHKVAYIRPFGEMNGSHNPYCAYNRSGSKRGPGHSTAYFKRAWRRIVIIVKGGASLAGINHRLRKQHLPTVKHRKATIPSSFPAAPVSFVWTPEYVSSPAKRGNAPSKYFPGNHWVDWVGTDFYSKTPEWRRLAHFYNRWKSKPFVLGEWGVVDGDNPKFIRRMFDWAKKHRRTKMLIYYRGFSHDPYDPSHYPGVMRALRHRLKSSYFPGYTPENVQPPTGGVGP